MPSDFPAPPYMRQSKPGKARVRLKMTAPDGGKHQANTCVAPLSYTDGKGERVFYKDREVKTDNPLIAD
ncbi:hypothetical protein N9917_00585 [Deltaproteobacteria bacterium]|nr:hypothetical protein [Deltaproteobacteria bacterium]